MIWIRLKRVLDKHNLTALDVKGVNYEKHWTGRLGADWCGAIIYGVDDILSENPGSKYIVIEDSNEADYDEDYEPVYDYDFTMNDAISEITEENGFTDIQAAEGKGRDG